MPDLYDPQQAQMSQQSATERLADYITDLLARPNLQLWLYSNNVGPSPTTTISAFVEAVFSGQSRFNVLAAGFNTPGVDAQSNAYATSGMAEYVSAAGGVTTTVYGSILVATPAGGVQAVATNAGAGGGSYSAVFTLSNAGAAYQVAPTIKLNGATGSGATAHAVLNANGTISAIVLDTPGSGYTTYPVVIDPPMELIKQNVLSSGGIPMGTVGQIINTYTQLIEPSNPS